MVRPSKSNERRDLDGYGSDVYMKHLSRNLKIEKNQKSGRLKFFAERGSPPGRHITFYT